MNANANSLQKSIVYIRHAQHNARGTNVARRGLTFGPPTLDEIIIRLTVYNKKFCIQMHQIWPAKLFYFFWPAWVLSCAPLVYILKFFVMPEKHLNLYSVTQVSPIWRKLGTAFELIELQKSKTTLGKARSSSFYQQQIALRGKQLVHLRFRSIHGGKTVSSYERS